MVNTVMQFLLDGYLTAANLLSALFVMLAIHKDVQVLLLLGTFYISVSISYLLTTFRTRCMKNWRTLHGPMAKRSLVTTSTN